MRGNISPMRCFPFSLTPFFFFNFQSCERYYCSVTLISILLISVSVTSRPPPPVSPLCASSKRCLRVEKHFFEEFWFAATCSLHCHYHNNDYDRMQWLLDNIFCWFIILGIFVAASFCCLIAIHLIKWSSSLDRNVMSLIWILSHIHIAYIG